MDFHTTTVALTSAWINTTLTTEADIEEFNSTIATHLRRMRDNHPTSQTLPTSNHVPTLKIATFDGQPHVMAATEGTLGEHAPLPCTVSVWLSDPQVVKFDYNAPWEDYAYPLDQTIAREIIAWSEKINAVRSRIEQAEENGTYTAHMHDFNDECQDLYDDGAMLAEKAADMLKGATQWETAHPNRSCLVSSGSTAEAW